MKKLGDRRGVALMLVLWLIVVLGAIAAGVVAAARSEVDVVMNVRTRSVARYAAESGVVAATAQLKRLLRIAATPQEQALVFRRLEELLRELQEQTLGSARFQVTVADLNARIDLNNADEATLLAFLQQFVDERKAEALVDALQDWKDDDDVPRAHGAEAQEYARVGSPFFPPNRPLQRLDDLTRISGFTDSVADVIAPYVTVYGDGRVNVNTAAKPVLTAVRGLGSAGADQIVSRREQGEVFESMFAVRDLLREAGAASGGFQLQSLTTIPKRVLVVSRGWEVGDPLTHEIQAVFELDGLQLADGPRLRVRYWTERGL